MDFIYDTIKKRNKKFTRKKGKFKTLKCHPKHFTSKNHTLRKSCLKPDILSLMKQIWNKRYPDNRILSHNSEDIWNKMKENMKSSCSNEMCWIKNTFKNPKVVRKLNRRLFAPTTPNSWKKNMNEWLSSNEIIDVMSQYEETFPEFKFFGPSPIDFDTMEIKDHCVWPEICNINIRKLLTKKKNKLGFIFNTDKHYQPGSHWIALFVDLKKNVIFSFDSNGDEEPEEITQLIRKINKQCKLLNLNMKIDTNFPKVHQRSNTECGMYCLYFIISLLKGTHNTDYFKKTRIPDKSVEKLRQIYFNNI